MTAVEVILLGCVIVGSALSWFISGYLAFDKGVEHGRQLEALSQMGCEGKLHRAAMHDWSRKTFPGMSEVKAADLGKARK